MSKIGDISNRVVRKSNAPGAQNQQRQEQQQKKDQGKQEQGKGGKEQAKQPVDSFVPAGKKNPVDITGGGTPKWTATEVGRSTPVRIEARLGNVEGKATVNILHTIDGGTREVDSFQTDINQGGIVHTSWTTKGIQNWSSGSIGFEIKTENSSYKSENDLTLKK